MERKGLNITEMMLIPERKKSYSFHIFALGAFQGDY
jgi:hypothetical protein